MAKTPTSSGSTSGAPPIVLPRRVAGKARSATPASGLERGSPLRADNLSPANQSITQQRAARTAPALMRGLVAANGLASTAVVNLVSTADSGYEIQAYATWTQEFSRQGLMAAEAVISALDTLWDYSKGYVDKRSLPMLVESALWETAQTGGIGMELVLDSYRLPRNIQLFPYDQVVWKATGDGKKYPVQKPLTGDEIELNYPTIFIGESLKSANQRYATPFIASGVQRLITYEDFVEDMWRVLKRAGEPRIVMKLDYDKVVSSAPAQAQGDEKKLSEYLEKVRKDIELIINDLAPEDALVVYDLVDVDHIASAGEKKDFSVLLQELAGQAASALKSNPSMLGMRSGGSQNVASVEAMISTKIAERLQKPVEEALSRALTMAVRLYGVDAYVKFKFKDINLRPEVELAAHRSMLQTMTLELLSLGRITDDEAQIMLGLGSLPESSEELSGTGFASSKSPDTMPASGTNARNASIAPTETPNSAGGKDNTQRP